ncbi:MerR family DNA-binding protein [Lentzea sp. HUAS TT2]|uniref:MerR family DNA-binding protein n=1 Tax=Lentzea sp. HUAS TT2 TaxID=3447454 RepID=UPI003F718F17
MCPASQRCLQWSRPPQWRGRWAIPPGCGSRRRMYPPETVVMIRVIKAAQRHGLTLNEVAELLDLGAHRHGRLGPQTRAIVKLAAVEAKIADREVIRSTRKAAAAARCDDLHRLLARPARRRSPALPRACCSAFYLCWSSLGRQVSSPRSASGIF